MTDTRPTFADICTQAATDQGLDGIVAYLRCAGYNVHVAQTGGYVMVAQITNTCNDGYFGITNEGGADDGECAILICFYEDEEDNEGRCVGGAYAYTTYDTYAAALAALLEEYIPDAVRNVIQNRDDVRAFVSGLLQAGINFHPDTRAAEYVTPLPPSYDAVIYRCFDVADDQGFDVYEVATEVFFGGA